MSEENVLTKEIAEQFIADDEAVDLSEFTAIDDEAARTWSQVEDNLLLSGLTSLSDAAAESLSKHEGHSTTDSNSLLQPIFRLSLGRACLCSGSLS